MDLTESIAPKSDQMNAEDLLSGPRVFTITDVREGSSDQPVWVTFAEHPQPFKPSKTVRRLMVLAWGTDSSTHIGKRMMLFRDPDVQWGGQDVGGIRVSHMSGIGKQLSVKLAVRKGQRALYVVDPLPDAPAPVPLDGLVAAFVEADITDPGARLSYCRGIVQRSLRSAADLTAAEVQAVIDALRQPEDDSTSIPPAADIAAEVPYEPSEAELAEIAEREIGGDR